MTSFITRGIILLLGYAYPAFECFKIVERNKPEIEQLIFWCQYWIIIAALTVFERVGDAFISWLPMYSEAKLAFIVYLWYPKTKGSTYVYEAFVKPFVTKHETDIDRNLLELKTRAGDMIVLYGRKSTIYIQARFIDILQYVAAQSPRNRPVEPRPTVPAAGPRQDGLTIGSRQAQPPVINHRSTPAAPDSGENTSSASESTEEMEVDPAEAKTGQLVPHDQNMEQVIRMTRSKLKQTRKKA
uniref:HVA22-like protein n=1 Tax=Picea sitchensis TaxID=3332 RepID=B8LQE5_PICSI|nr:unknown [Picea sitchensis]